MRKIFSLLLCAVMALGAVGCAKEGDTTKDGKVILPISNLYISDLDNAYTEYIEERFNVKIQGRGYSWADWDNQVTSAVNADNLKGVVHFNLTSRNYATLKRWAQGKSLRPLPENLSAYPNVKKLLDGATASQLIKVDGKHYALPISRLGDGEDLGLSKFTYVYRKDWVQKLAAAYPDRYGDLYKEDDVYTFAEFERLLYAFKDNAALLAGDKTIPLADVEWSFPSVINYYKKAPHAYVYDEAAGEYVWNYTTSEYESGLSFAKKLVDDKVYWADQYSSKDNGAFNKYKSGVVGVYFDNCVLTNYNTLRKDFKANNPTVDLDAATALMRLKSPEGKFVYEGTENWWSASLFAAEMTDLQMNKYLEVMDWLLSEEGTRLCTYGFEGTDYRVKEDGSIEVLWSKKTDGDYAAKVIGAAQLRFSVSLGYDMFSGSPLYNEQTRAQYYDWCDDITKQVSAGEAYVMPLYNEMNWLSAPNKDRYGNLFTDAQAAVIKYLYRGDSFNKFNEDNRSKYESVLKEINSALK